MQKSFVIHAFVCINKNKKDKSCGIFDSENIYDYLKTQLKLKKESILPEKHIKVVKTSCLGHCSAGPNIFVSPDNIWYTFSNKQDIDELIQTYFINGKKVERLVNQNIS